MSKSTVSLVLQENPRIPADTAERVRKAAQELGYVYNRGATALRGRHSTTIGMVINDLTNPFFVELLVAIERVLAEAGYTTLMAHTAESVTTQTRVLRSMREQNVAGLIMSPALGTDESLPAEVRSWGIPLVLVMRLMGDDVDTVGVDNEYGFALATATSDRERTYSHRFRGQPERLRGGESASPGQLPAHGKGTGFPWPTSGLSMWS